MDSLFEPSNFESSSNSFLSFSSFADLNCSTSQQPISPSLDNWDELFSTQLKEIATSSSASSSSDSLFASSDSSASPRTDPFEIVHSAFEPALNSSTSKSSSSFGIFHTPSRAGPSKLSSSDLPTPGLIHRVTSSDTDVWDTPLVTPALSKASSSGNSAGYTSPDNLYLPPGGFNWDDAHLNLGASSSYSPPKPTKSVSPSPLRVASNPTLSASITLPRTVKAVTSMPALTEEIDPSFASWLEEAEALNNLGESSKGDVNENGNGQIDQSLPDDFEWVFGDLGLGNENLNDSNFQISTDGTIFQAFQEQETSFSNYNSNASSSSNPTPVPTVSSTTSPTEVVPSASIHSLHSSQSVQSNHDFSWVPSFDNTTTTSSNTPSASVSAESVSVPVTIQPSAAQSSTTMMQQPNFEVNYSMAPSSVMDDGMLRSSAARSGNVEGLGLLSVRPMSGQMSRSFTAPGQVLAKSAPTQNHFAYNSLQYTAVNPQQLYQQQATYAPAQVLPIQQSRPVPVRRASHGLTITVNPSQYSTYNPSQFPLTPQSAPYSMPSSAPTFQTSLAAQQQAAFATQQFQSQQPQQQPQQQQKLRTPAMALRTPVPMTRAGTQPLPMTRRLSGAQTVSNMPMPAHIMRAQAIVQMQEAKEEAQRQELRRQAAARRVNMAEASVMQAPTQPTVLPNSLQAQQVQQMMNNQQNYQQTQQQQQQQGLPRSQPAIVGWGAGTSTSPQRVLYASASPLTHQPLIVHPPPAGYTYVATPTHVQRIHPPPHPMAAGRPMARLPSPKRRTASSTSPKKSPLGKKRGPMQPGGFSWGEATFINFTADDSEKLLTGVAPSGSQSKRKREEEAARLNGMMLTAVDMDRDGSKRSRNGE